MTQITASVKRALSLIGTGTVVTTGYALALGSSPMPTIYMSTGAVIGIALVIACGNSQPNRKE